MPNPVVAVDTAIKSVLLTADFSKASPPQPMVKFGKPSDMILQVARAKQADLIIMGLDHSRHVDTAAHLPYATAYEVICRAQCPVLTMRN